MSDIQGCLSVFAVSAWSNDEAGYRRAVDAIEAYLDDASPADQKAAMVALLQAYRGMPSDSHIARAINARIENRLTALADAAGSPAQSTTAMDV